MHGIFTYIWLVFMVNVGKYTIHGWYGMGNEIQNKYQNEITKVLTVNISPSKIEWDLTNGPQSKLLELLDTQV